jgi:hypothetical protein
MCPVCLATAAIIAGSATGTGGLTALVANKFRKRKSKGEFPRPTEPKEDCHGPEPYASAAPESGAPRPVD